MIFHATYGCKYYILRKTSTQVEHRYFLSLLELWNPKSPITDANFFETERGQLCFVNP